MTNTLLYRTLALLLVGLSLSAPISAQPKRPMRPADALRVATVGDAQISPDGHWVVYTVSTFDGDGARSALWITRVAHDTWQIALDAARPSSRSIQTAQLLAGEWNASNPRWSPDSRRIAFLVSERDQKSIYVMSVEDRQPKMVVPISETNFHLAYDGEIFAWSPDGKRLAFISATNDDDNDDEAGRRTDPRVIDRIQYKSRTAFSDNKRTHLFIIDVDDERAIPQQLTDGRFYDHAVSWSPRGDEIAFLSNREVEPDANNNSDIFAVTTNGRVRQITTTAGCEYEPQWSPDGRWIAYTATRRDVTSIDSVAEDTHVWIIDSGGGRGRELTLAQDRRARSPRWASDSRSILFLAGDRGKTGIYEVQVSSVKVQGLPLYAIDGEAGGPFRIVDPRISRDEASAGNQKYQIGSFSIAARTTAAQRPGVTSALVMPLAVTAGNSVRPAEVWFGYSIGAPLRRMSAHNEALLGSSLVVAPEEINFKSFDGTPIQAWLIKPVDWREGQRYPLILSIHGGPHGMYGYSFNPTFQVYAARGFAVLYMNPRGSNGYGQKFSDGTLREWGGGDYKDLMIGVDEALRRFAWIDPDRMGVTGGSYGGFMTNWIVTQTPRFKAAVAVASLSNLVSFYSTSLYQDLIHAEFGLPWDDYDLLWRWSPLRYVRQTQTPTLLLHGEQDNDVHITQAEEMYMALRRRGVETQLVRYPREGHGFREPQHRVDALERTVAWFDRFLK